MTRLLPALALVLLAACSNEPTPDPTPVPTTYPAAAPDAAATLAARYLDAWAAGDYAAMYATIDPALQDTYPVETFTELHAAFAEMAEVTSVAGSTGEPTVIGLPPGPRPPDFPAPTATPAPTVNPSASADPSSTPVPTPGPAVDPEQPLDGPVPGLAVPLEIEVASERFGDLSLDRGLTLVEGRDGWLVRWSPELLFP